MALGHHQWIEFSGFLNEYVKICAQALANEIDFQEELPPIEEFRAKYIAEKLQCIFGDQVEVRYVPS